MTRPFILAVSGSRHLTDRAFVWSRLAHLSKHRRPHLVLIHGACRGADRLAAEWARSEGLRPIPFPADWDRHGKRAGPLRNWELAHACDALVAFRTPDSLGTTDCVHHAVYAGHRPIVVVYDVELDAGGMVRRVLDTQSFNRRPLDPATHQPANLAYR